MAQKVHFFPRLLLFPHILSTTTSRWAKVYVVVHIGISKWIKELKKLHPSNYTQGKRGHRLAQIIASSDGANINKFSHKKYSSSKSKLIVTPQRKKQCSKSEDLNQLWKKDKFAQNGYERWRATPPSGQEWILGSSGSFHLLTLRYAHQDVKAQIERYWESIT